MTNTRIGDLHLGENRPRTDGEPATRLATVGLPLRGLASTGADAIVTPALGELPGVVDVDVRAAEFKVRVHYDPGRVTREAIDARLHALGVGTPQPHSVSGDGTSGGEGR